MDNKRIHTLDYLRGLAALGVMSFHYYGWIFNKTDSADITTKLGVYCVEIFYILSGLTLYLVYDKSDYKASFYLREFFAKRVFRIFPLIWLIIILTIVVKKLHPDIFTVFINFTGLFGVIHRKSYLAQGAWSIGNELVFYIFFPFTLALLKYKEAFFHVIYTVSGIIFLYFTFYLMNPDDTIENQWVTYINPFNQIFYFFSGIFLGKMFNNISIKVKFNLLLLITSILIFTFYPVSGNRINLTTGYARIILSILCIIICFCFYKNKMELPSILHRPLATLGEISYSLYLVHPILYNLSRKITISNDIAFHSGLKAALLLITIIVTFGVSNLIHKYYESYFINKGRDFIKWMKRKTLIATTK